MIHRHFRSDQSLDALRNLCANMKNRRVCIQIGCYMGEDTAVFASFFDQVIAIDPWSFADFAELTAGREPPYAGSNGETGPQIEKKFDENTQRLDNVKKIKAQADSQAEEYDDESIDLIYIDSIHQYKPLLGHITAWARKLKEGGTLAGHDYRPSFPDVIATVNAIAAASKKQLHIYRDSSWALRNRNPINKMDKPC